MNRIITNNSNKMKNNKILDKENNKNRLMQIKLSKIKEKVIVLDSKQPIHPIIGNNN